MSKLTDTQLIVLSKAAARDDGAAILPERLAKGAAMKVGASLGARKLMREIRAKPGMPVWREDEEGRRLALVITRAGRDAIGVEGDDAPPDVGKAVASGSKMRGQAGSKTQSRAAASRRAGTQLSAPQISAVNPQPACSLPREGSKQAMIITMLEKSKGASLEALIEATGWLPHTMRAALTGLRKRGFTVERTKGEAGAVYHIVTSSKATA
jgi:hypothetical protein